MIDLFAYIGGFFAMVSFVPQIWKSLSTRSTRDLSWWMMLTTLISVSSYQVYAYYLELLPVMITNGVFLLTILLLMAIKFCFDGFRGQLDRPS